MRRNEFECHLRRVMQLYAHDYWNGINQERLILVGDSAMLFYFEDFDAEDATRGVWTSTGIREAIVRVAQESDLDPLWLNRFGTKGSSNGRTSLLFENKAVRVELMSREALLVYYSVRLTRRNHITKRQIEMLFRYLLTHGVQVEDTSTLYANYVAEIKRMTEEENLVLAQEAIMYFGTLRQILVKDGIIIEE